MIHIIANPLTDLFLFQRFTGFQHLQIGIIILNRLCGWDTNGWNMIVDSGWCKHVVARVVARTSRRRLVVGRFHIAGKFIGPPSRPRHTSQQSIRLVQGIFRLPRHLFGILQLFSLTNGRLYSLPSDQGGFHSRTFGHGIFIFAMVVTVPWLRFQL